MAMLVETLTNLWTRPVPPDPEGRRAFGLVYTDPVLVNGAPLRLDQLVERARSLQRAFESLDMRVHDAVETPDRLVLAFTMTGRHVGPLASAYGVVAATGHDIAVRTVDVLMLAAGRIEQIWVVSDELGLHQQVGALPRP